MNEKEEIDLEALAEARRLSLELEAELDEELERFEELVDLAAWLWRQIKAPQETSQPENWPKLWLVEFPSIWRRCLDRSFVVRLGAVSGGQRVAQLSGLGGPARSRRAVAIGRSTRSRARVRTRPPCTSCGRKGLMG
jgi:hypothetical protein